MIARPLSLVAAAMFVLLVVGCAANPTPPPASVATAAPVPAGRMQGYVVARRHGDFVLVDGKEQRREVEYGWDYARGVALRKTFDVDGHLLETKEMVGANLSLTGAEAERARALVRAQPELKSLVGKSDVVIWAGGFAFRKPGDPYCDRGSRCIHAIAAADQGDTVVAHAIVDLQSDRVVYPFYQPADGEPFAKTHGE